MQHQSWETRSAFGFGQGSTVTAKVKRLEQAGGLSGATIDYSAVVSLWVAPAIGVDVYTQVRDQVRPEWSSARPDRRTWISLEHLRGHDPETTRIIHGCTLGSAD